MSGATEDRLSNGIYTIIIEVNAVDLYAIRKYEEFIKTQASIGHKIPGRVIMRFFSFFRNVINPKYEENIFKQKEIDALLYNIKTSTLGRFLCNKEYNFPEFQKMIDELFYYLSQNLLAIWNNTEYNKRKEMLIDMVYNNINKYFASDDKTKELEFGKYKRCALCGYILWRFGFHLSQKITPKQLNGKEPTNQQLYESIKYYVNEA